MGVPPAKLHEKPFGADRLRADSCGAGWHPNATRFSKVAISGNIVPQPGPGNAGGLRRRFFLFLDFSLTLRDYPKEPAARPPALPGEDCHFGKTSGIRMASCPTSGNRLHFYVVHPVNLASLTVRIQLKICVRGSWYRRGRP